MGLEKGCFPSSLLLFRKRAPDARAVIGMQGEDSRLHISSKNIQNK